MKKNLRLLAIAILCLFIAIIVAGYYYYQTQQHKMLILYGNVDIRTVNLSFRVNGKLQTLNVDEGDKISPGQILASLDKTPYQNSLKRATGILTSAKAKLDKLESGYRSQEIAQVEAEVAQRQAAWKYANSFYQRQQGLWTQRVISANDLENAKNNRNQALAALNAAKDKLNQYHTGYRTEEIAAARGEWEQAVAALAQAKLDLEDTILTTPSPGTILTRAIEPGTILTAGSTVFTVSLIQPVWVRAYVSEPHLGEAIPGREILLYTDSRPEQPYHGTIGFISPTAEFTPKSVQTTDLRTDLVYRIRVIVNDADDMLRQGMPVTLHFAAKKQ